MRVLTLLSIVTMAVGASAQTANAPVGTAGILILRVELQRTKSRAPQTKSAPRTYSSSQSQKNADEPLEMGTHPAMQRPSKDADILANRGSDPFGDLQSGSSSVFVASIVVKNIGAKTVTAVRWEYLLFEAGGREPIRRYRVQSKRVIPPGQQAELTKEVKPKGNEHQALITRVEYADGSVWQPK
jgi:hypothetical protein